MKIKRSDKRGVSKLAWLDSKHSFSFGDYYDPENMGFRSLRVINDDIIEPGQGFGTHPHRDMEIISVVTEGALAHRDNLGHGETLKPGEVQVMSAGRGIEHSEFNPSSNEKAHLLQIWITPERRGLQPSYGQRAFAESDRTNRLLRVAGPERELNDSALRINQDADVYLVRVEPGRKVSHTLKATRAAWVHVIEGEGKVNSANVSAGDAASLEQEQQIVLEAGNSNVEFLLFDLK